MGPFIRSGERVAHLLTLFTIGICATYAQTPSTNRCHVSAAAIQVRAEGLTERLGDILLQCSASASATVTGTLGLTLPVSITNRVNANNQTLDPVLLVDYGMGFGPSGIAGTVSNQNITFSVNLTAPVTGNFNLKISNLRAAVAQLGVSSNFKAIFATLAFSGSGTDASQLIVGYSSTALYATQQSTTIFCAGSPLPDLINITNLFSTGTAFAANRLTEGFASAFEPRVQGADSGTRFLINFSGFPAATHLYIPDLIGGSDAATPTAGGKLNLPQASGQYLPGSGTLLLSRVLGADSKGAGGSPLAAPTGSSPVLLNSVNEVPLLNGSGYAVYEVLDANPGLIESAELVTFIGLPASTPPATAQEYISLAPVSQVSAATQLDPIPRFVSVAPPSNCSLAGDCGATYYPIFQLRASPIQLSGVAGGPVTSQGSFAVENSGGGQLNWNAAVTYVNGSDWLQLDQTSSINNALIHVSAKPQALAPGTYQANVMIDAGSAGRGTVPVTLTVAAAPVIPSVNISRVVNSATFAVTPFVPGSLATLMGSHLAGKNVSVTFDGKTGTVLYSGDTQINVQLPADLASQTSAKVVVTVDGVSSAPQTVTLAPAWPAIFAHGVLNQGNSENLASAAARSGEVLQIFATGIPNGATVSAQIQDRKDLVPIYAGPAPTVLGVQQVNVRIPDGVPSGNTQLIVCAVVAGSSYCSPGYTIAIQ